MHSRYRRNVGDTLINACYVLRDQFLENMLADMKVQLPQSQTIGREQFVWEVSLYFREAFSIIDH
jgi:hypothetical protein